MSTSSQSVPGLDRLQTMGLGAGVVGLILLAVGFLIGRENGGSVWPGYLIGWLLWNGITVGCLGLLMLHHMVGGGWGYSIRRILETGATMLPLTLLFLIPMLLPGVMEHIWEWSNTTAVKELPAAEQLIVNRKAIYLNTPFFLARIVVYFSVWMLMAFLLDRYSAASDKGDGPAYAHKFKVVSAPGILVHALLVTFYSVDFVMSLEPTWYSSIFGLLTIVGQTLSTVAISIIVLNLIREEPIVAGFVEKKHFHDLGNLCLAFVMLWAYMSYSQYMISWAGNLPEEAKWYLHRLDGGWTPIAWSLTILHFFFPFLILLSRNVKRNASAIAKVGIALLVMRVYDLFWIVMPVFHKSRFDLLEGKGPIDLLMVVAGVMGIGGIWLGVFAMRLKKRRLLPVYPSFMEYPVVKGEVAHHEAH